MNFEEMMKNQDTLDSELESVNSNSNTESVPSFKLTFNADNVASAKIRFLPPGPLGGPFVFKWREHSIQNPYTSTTCPTTFGEPCELCDKGWEYHNLGDAAMRGKLLGSERYACWVYVVADPLNPQNVGKILLYRYGRMIAKMIEEKLKPQFGEDPANVFRLDKGCTLVIKAAKVNNMPKYDGTYFADPSMLEPVGETLKEMWERIPSLQDEFISTIQKPDQGKLKMIMATVLGEELPVNTQVPAERGMPRPKPNTDIKTKPNTEALEETPKQTNKNETKSEENKSDPELSDDDFADF